ncbi:MAG: PDZ domain-containing protein [Actinomycetota bacterium]
MEQPDDTLAAPDAPTETVRRRMWNVLGFGVGVQWFGFCLCFVLGAAIVGGLLFKVPYVALVPGSARDTEPLLEVSGIDNYPSEGELLLTTVRIRPRPNLWEYLWLRTDDDAEIVPEEAILGGRSPEENREFNLQLMTDSKSIAIAVALEQLGYDAIQTDGVVIADLVEGAAAEEVLMVGDTIVEIDGRPVTSSGELVELLTGYEVGDEITMVVESLELSLANASGADAGDVDDGDGVGDDSSTTTEDDADAEDEPGQAPGVRTETVVLGPKPEEPEVAFLGVAPSDRVDFNNDFDFLVDIDSGAVGGPSAGLAFTLAVLDELTEGELTGGATVAVTGTIDPAGRVGAVGGVVQKTAAVRDLGADAFLVPAGLGEAELERVMERGGRRPGSNSGREPGRCSRSVGRAWGRGCGGRGVCRQ